MFHNMITKLFSLGLLFCMAMMVVPSSANVPAGINSNSCGQIFFDCVNKKGTWAPCNGLGGEWMGGPPCTKIPIPDVTTCVSVLQLIQVLVDDLIVIIDVNLGTCRHVLISELILILQGPNCGTTYPGGIIILVSLRTGGISVDVEANLTPLLPICVNIDLNLLTFGQAVGAAIAKTNLAALNAQICIPRVLLILRLGPCACTCSKRWLWGQYLPPLIGPLA